MKSNTFDAFKCRGMIDMPEMPAGHEMHEMPKMHDMHHAHENHEVCGMKGICKTQETDS